MFNHVTFCGVKYHSIQPVETVHFSFCLRSLKQTDGQAMECRERLRLQCELQLLEAELEILKAYQIIVERASLTKRRYRK